MAAEAENDPDPQGRSLRAQVRLTLALDATERRRLKALAMAIVAAALESPTIATQVRAANKQGLAQASSEGIDLGRALVVQMALDGYWLNDSVGTLKLDAGQKAAFREALLGLLKEGSKS
jgi:hypothetical protein